MITKVKCKQTHMHAKENIRKGPNITEDVSGCIISIAVAEIKITFEHYFCTFGNYNCGLISTLSQFIKRLSAIDATYVNTLPRFLSE